MKNEDAIDLLRQFVLTGTIKMDAELLRSLGCEQRELEQILAADKVRHLMDHYWLTEKLTLENAQRLLAKWRQRNDLPSHSGDAPE